jgi:hypothetical protein
MLDDVDLAMVEVNRRESHTAQLLGRNVLNAGVIAFRKSAVMKDLLASWLRLQTQYLAATIDDAVDKFPELSQVQDVDAKRLLLLRDQASLSTFLSPEKNEFGVRLRVLDQNWNFRRNSTPVGMDIVIHHANLYKVSPEAAKEFLLMRFGQPKPLVNSRPCEAPS